MLPNRNAWENEDLISVTLHGTYKTSLQPLEKKTNIRHITKKS